jgi:hypothetical protein
MYKHHMFTRVCVYIYMSLDMEIPFQELTSKETNIKV